MHEPEPEKENFSISNLLCIITMWQVWVFNTSLRPDSVLSNHLLVKGLQMSHWRHVHDPLWNNTKLVWNWRRNQGAHTARTNSADNFLLQSSSQKECDSIRHQHIYAFVYSKTKKIFSESTGNHSVKRSDKLWRCIFMKCDGTFSLTCLSSLHIS